jgi:PAS domain S-box-containing protein
MMSLFAYFAIAACFICFFLAVTVYFFNRKSPLNRAFIAAILLGGYAAFTSFMVLEAADSNAAYIWNKAGFLWPFFLALLLQFTLVFTESRLASHRLRFLVLYIPALVFSLLDLTTDQMSGFPIKTQWGYTFPGADTWASAASSLWSVALSFTAILLCAAYSFRAKNDDKKRQARLITLGLAYPIIVNVLVLGAFFLFGWSLPMNGSGANALLCIFIVVAIWKHGLFNLNPAIAAENIIATMPDSFILTDVNGSVLRVNPALNELLGYQEDDLAGKAVNQVFADDETATILQNIGTEMEIKNYETQLKTKDGSQKPVAISASIIENKRGKHIGIALIIHDLTRRKQNEQKLVKAERFAAIGELAGMIGHDLRNPLTSIQGATYYLKLKYAKDMSAPAREMLDTIDKSIQYSNKIINDLLDYSRDIKLELEETTPKSLVANALAIVQPPPKVTLQNFAMDTPNLRLDSVKMGRVFTNIIKNAFDAMPKGGTLTITSNKTEDTLEVLFQDTGTGMSQETIQKLWTPLFTTKAKGMGFGLPICKRIVEAHGGKIQVQSAPEKGTTFIVALPLDSKTKFNST